MSLRDRLRAKLLGLPVWLWVVIVLLVVGYIYYRRQQAAAQAAADQGGGGTADTTGTDTGAAADLGPSDSGTGSMLDGYAGGSPGGGFPSGGGGGFDTGGGSFPIDPTTGDTSGGFDTSSADVGSLQDQLGSEEQRNANQTIRLNRQAAKNKAQNKRLANQSKRIRRLNKKISAATAVHGSKPKHPTRHKKHKAA